MEKNEIGVEQIHETSHLMAKTENGRSSLYVTEGQDQEDEDEQLNAELRDSYRYLHIKESDYTLAERSILKISELPDEEIYDCQCFQLYKPRDAAICQPVEKKRYKNALVIVERPP